MADCDAVGDGDGGVPAGEPPHRAGDGAGERDRGQCEAAVVVDRPVKTTRARGAGRTAVILGAAAGNGYGIALRAGNRPFMVKVTPGDDSVPGDETPVVAVQSTRDDARAAHLRAELTKAEAEVDRLEAECARRTELHRAELSNAAAGALAADRKEQETQGRLLELRDEELRLRTRLLEIEEERATVWTNLDGARKSVATATARIDAARCHIDRLEAAYVLRKKAPEKRVRRLKEKLAALDGDQ